ncbi:hemolysin XhlA family protein [Youxingia wuxianensis]|uniref:Uncharacterized protein n=1 Tax=Youxingia wuxianensis TaxID=2763678 RepID=A0A926ENS3_9FIRM|nr:hemolysin XhlA family protein [Youxingia wuxianensis]MBC8585338.1 hypothetical protein [Youxingia wuxianensis]
MDIEDMKYRLDRMEKDIDSLFKKTNAAAVAQAAVDEKLSSMMSTLAELKEGVSLLQQTPLKRYEAIIGAVITAFVSAFLGFFFGKWM